MENKKTIVEKIKDLMFSDITDEKFLDVKDSEGNVLRVAEDELAVGQSVMTITEDGEVPAVEGEYLLEDGQTLVIDAEGVITEIVEAVEEETEETEEVEEVEASEEVVEDAKFATIMEISKWEIEVDADNIEVGTKLKQVGFEDETWTLNDGEYELEDGRKIQVDSDGVVVLITEANGSVEETEEVEEEVVEEVIEDEAFTALKQEHSLLVEKFSKLEELVGKLSDEPAEEELKIKKQGFLKSKSKNNAFEDLRNFRK